MCQMLWPRMDTITILTTPLWDVAQCPPGGALGEWTLSGLKVNTDPSGQLWVSLETPD